MFQMAHISFVIFIEGFEENRCFFGYQYFKKLEQNFLNIRDGAKLQPQKFYGEVDLLQIQLKGDSMEKWTYCKSNLRGKSIPN